MSVLISAMAAHPDEDLCYTAIYSTESKDSVSEQCRPRSDGADAWAALVSDKT